MLVVANVIQLIYSYTNGNQIKSWGKRNYSLVRVKYGS